MGKKSKKRSAAPGARHKGRPDAALKPAANPFEQLYARKKFDILGKRQKGGPQSKLQARSQANQRRKDTLLIEYKQARKANNFVDRRFGEEDEELTAEDKAVMRFQKQRIKDAASSRFQLPDEDGDGGGRGEGLTHMGRSLSEFDDFPGAGSGSDDEADAALDAEAMAALHFGGGFVRKAPGDASVEPERHKNKKEVMEELIAKSKAGKAERQQQREEDLTQTEALDATFRELLDGTALQGVLRPKGEKIDPRTIQQGEEAAQFDRMRRELTWSARGAAADRTRTAEELTELERLRLEALERQRLKRMRDAGGDDDEFASDADDAAAPLGGYARRRHKAARAEKQEIRTANHEGGGDDLDDDFAAGSGSDGESGSGGSGSGDSEDEEGAGPLQRRQRERAAGDHELQARLRQVSAALLQKHGVQPSKQSAAELAAELSEGGSDVESSGSEESGSDEEAGSSEDEGSDSDADADADADADEAAGTTAAGAGSTRSRKQAVGSVPDATAEVAGADAAATALEARRQSGGDASTAAEQPQPKRQVRAPPQLTGPLDVSFVPEAPKTYEEFSALVGGRQPEDLPLIISRIRGANAAALAADNRRGLQSLYGFLVQHFVELAARHLPALAHFDALTPALVSTAAEVPFYAATLARARLGRAQQRLAAALKDPGEANDYGWPGSAALLSLRLWGATFPLSDKRHPVATPAALLTGAYLAACPLVVPRHAALGLLLAGLAHQGAAAGGRLAPEALNFLADLLADAAQGSGDNVLHLPPLPTAAAGASHPPPAPLQLSAVLGLPRDDPHFSSPDFAASVVAAALQLLALMAADLQQSPAFPELFQPSASALDVLATACSAHAGLEALRAETLADLRGKSEAAISTRRPLARKPNKAAAVKLYNPRFEEEFVAGKDFDPDRERAATKWLKRQVQKERRGAMRELRKDASFLDTEREKERNVGKNERRTQRRAGFAVLEQLEADMKSGGQGGLWKKRKPK